LLVDLRNAFDTADHNLLYKLLEMYGAPKNIINLAKRLHDDFVLKLLEIYGAPENIINLIKCLHDDFVLKLRIGNETREIPYGKGIKQGDVMAPILFLFLFLFLMLAFSETLEEEYEEWGKKPSEFKYHADITKGQLTTKIPNSAMSSTYLPYCSTPIC
jgi:hypothetical protein